MQYINNVEKIDIIKEARLVFDKEISALKKMRDSISDDFEKILELIVNCHGKVIVTGMGKPGHIATKISTTLSSLGTPSLFLHPAEAMHGDLGIISPNDVVIVISYSGESDEIIRILPGIKLMGAVLAGITGNGNSTLAHVADVVQILPEIEEACYLGMAPTSSTTVELVYGDALAVVASRIYGFKDSDFGKRHPAGSLGKKLLLTVENLMTKDYNNAVVSIDVTLKDAIVELSRKGLGVVSVIDEHGNLKGIVTDGDLRRLLERESDIYSLPVKDVMSENPVTISKEKMAVEALNLLKENNISCLPVLEDLKLIGTIRLQDIIGVGIVG